ncbi:hypothetical protein CHARACLAT_024687 [Characodon lateralis]|uniref:Uncharacterized protein n=1 Tax=Characodon lateralis TaxID=208331 RepID=A0ABU7DTV4_9TELE|nr:hypothetical protein [Characodon lateralis]
MSFVLRNLSSDQLSSVQSVLSLPLLQTAGPVSCLHSGDHLHSSKNITNRTNQALRFTLQLLPVPDALLAFHGLPFSDKLCSLARSLSDAAYELTNLDARSKPPRNKPLHRRPYLPAFLSDQHQLQVPAPTSTNPRLAPAY